MEQVCLYEQLACTALRHSHGAFKYLPRSFILALSPSLPLSLCVTDGLDVGEAFSCKLQKPEAFIWPSASLRWLTIPNNPLYLTFPGHSMQLLYLLSKDSYWEQNEVGIEQC